MTETEYSRWLRDDNAQRVWLVELDRPNGTERIARGTYIEPGAVWSDVLDELDFEDRLDGDTAIDQLTLINTGERDSWLSTDWDGQPVRIWLGDVSWPRSDFRLIAQLINAGISDFSRTSISFALHNPLALLDVPVQPVVDNQNVPVIFGSPFNVSPVLIDQNLGYQLHSDSVTISAVRDKGWPVASYTANTHGFSLDQNPAGDITVDATAPFGTSKEIIQHLAQSVGLSVNAASLDALPNYPVAYYANNGENKRAVLDAVLTGLGAKTRLNALGEVDIAITQPISGTPDLTLTSDDIVDISLVAVERPARDLIVKYGRNWTVQGDNALAGAVTPEDRQRYSTEWQQLTQDIATTNPLTDRIERETLFTNQADAQAELDKLASLRGVARQRWRLQVVGAGLEIRAGQTVRIHWPRWGFETGRDALVLSNAPHGRKLQQSEIEVWL